MSRGYPDCPTSEQCTKNETVTWDDETGVAVWYPQMGGYGAKCVVQSESNGGCFNAYIWHDGEFPFEAAGGGNGRPALLHHCEPEQFLRFARDVMRVLPDTVRR